MNVNNVIFKFITQQMITCKRSKQVIVETDFYLDFYIEIEKYF